MKERKKYVQAHNLMEIVQTKANVGIKTVLCDAQ